MSAEREQMTAVEIEFGLYTATSLIGMDGCVEKLVTALIEARAERDRLDVLIGDTGNHWLALTNDIRIQWEGAIDEAMRAACDKIRELTTEADALRTQLAAARDAFDTVISLAPVYCEHLHHTRRDRHQMGNPCPVEARIRDLTAALSEAL